MAAIPVVTPDLDGVALSPTVATAGPDTIACGGSDINLLVDNANASPTVVTVTTPGNTEWGQAMPDAPSMSITNGTKNVMRIPARLADPTTGLISVTAVPNTSVSLYAMRAH